MMLTQANTNHPPPAAALGYRATFERVHLLFPDYIYGVSLTSFSQTDGEQLALTIGWTQILLPDISEGAMTQAAMPADPSEGIKQCGPRASPLSGQLR